MSTEEESTVHSPQSTGTGTAVIDVVAEPVDVGASTETEIVPTESLVSKPKKVMGPAMAPGTIAVVTWTTECDTVLCDVQSPSCRVLEIQIGDGRYPREAPGQSAGKSAEWEGRLVKAGTRVGAVLKNTAGNLRPAEAVFWHAVKNGETENKDAGPSQSFRSASPVHAPSEAVYVQATVTSSNLQEAEALPVRDEVLVRLPRRKAELLMRVCRGTSAHPGELSGLDRLFETALKGGS